MYKQGGIKRRMIEKKVRERRGEVRMSVLGLKIKPPCKALGGGTEDKLACSLVCPPNPSLDLRAEWVGTQGIWKGLG